MSSAWLMDETPGIYVWKVRVGWRVRVTFQFAGTTARWFPTNRMAKRWAEMIVRTEG